MIRRELWHKSLTDEVIAEAVERGLTSLDNPGFCLICGEEHDSCEPDAPEYPCESCGSQAVYGAEWLLMGLPIK